MRRLPYAWIQEWHTLGELRAGGTSESWGAESAPSTFTGYDRGPFLTGPAEEFGIASEGALTGPSLIWAGAATRQAGQRGVGPFVNLNIGSPAVEGVTADPVHFYRDAPDGGGWQWCQRYHYHGDLSPKVNVAVVRIHVRAYDLFDSGGAVISPVKFRSYSVADLPLNGSPKALTYYRGPITTVTTTSLAGEWLDLGTVRLARGDAGLSYFMLGFFIDVDPDEGVLFSTKWILNAISVVPFAKDLSGGGFGGDIDKESP
ncbi:MAG: hypothetical protein H0T76_05980 [Nannocystis sp.]|nr:hypothetical protein [Nannocystis sp.]